MVDYLRWLWSLCDSYNFLLILTGHSFDVGQAVSEVGGEQLGGAYEEQSREEDLSCVEAEMGVFDITSQTPSSMPAAKEKQKEA